MKKKLILCLLTVALSLGLSTTASASDNIVIDVLNTAYVTVYGLDDNSIDTADQLLAFALGVNSGLTSTQNSTWHIASSIDLDDATFTNAWSGVGTADYPFQGTFIGVDDGSTITLENDGGAVSAGLFNYVGETATIENINVTGLISSTDSNIGGLATVLTGGTITNCSNSATISTSGGDYVGGLVAMGFGTISNCSNSGTINASSAGYAGGIVGAFSGEDMYTLQSCFNTGAINGSAATAGGIVGFTDYDVAQSYNTGNLSAVIAGGIVGTSGSNDTNTNTNGTDVSYCFNAGSISVSTAGGGLVGYAEDTVIVTDCYNVGTIQDKGSSATLGGIVGDGNTSITIAYTYNVEPSALNLCGGDARYVSNSYTGTTLDTGTAYTGWDTGTTAWKYVAGHYPQLSHFYGQEISSDTTLSSGPVMKTPLTSDMFIFNGYQDVLVYDGEPVTLAYQTDLEQDTNYTVTYTNNTGATTIADPATLTITGQGDYTGTLSYTFRILAVKADNLLNTEDVGTSSTTITMTNTNSQALFLPEAVIDNLPILGWLIESSDVNSEDPSNTGIVYDPNVVFYLRKDATLTITPVTAPVTE